MINNHSYQPPAGADQNPVFSLTTVPPTINRLKHISYSDAAKTGLPVNVAPKKQQRVSWSSIRTDNETRMWCQVDSAPDVIFARPMLGNAIGINYDKRTQHVYKVVRAVLNTFPDAVALDHYFPGVIYVLLETEEEKNLALGTEIPFHLLFSQSR